jgi:o-succinylbenzoate---CoA ligase
MFEPSEDWLLARVRATPQAPAVIIRDDEWNYTELNALADQVIFNLSPYTGDGIRIATFLPNNLLFVCLIHALARCGAILVPLNTRLTDEELIWQLKRANCSTLVIEKEAADRFEGINMENLKVIYGSDLMAGAGNTNKITNPPYDSKKTQAIVFTSGTTGTPKGAKLSFANHFYSAIGSGYRLGVSTNDVWLCCLPLYHVGGLAIILRSCLYGTAVELHNGFDVAAISDNLDKRNISLISLVPTMLQRLLKFREGRHWPDSIRHILVGGAAVPQELLSECHDLGLPVSVTYGLTEAASQVATMIPRDVKKKPGSAGKPLLFTRLAIVSEEGHELPANEVGEIIISGPMVMNGYDQDEGSTSRVLKDGWLHTGDVGLLDDDGDLWVKQRRSDIIISGGENIYPAEVEVVLNAHPAVSQACVVGLQDPEWGQCVSAAVTLEDNEQITIPELISFCRQHIAGYKVPRQMVILPKMPLTASGKIHRQAVAELINNYY